jgi:hypothetical protein
LVVAQVDFVAGNNIKNKIANRQLFFVFMFIALRVGLAIQRPAACRSSRFAPCFRPTPSPTGPHRDSAGRFGYSYYYE